MRPPQSRLAPTFLAVVALCALAGAAPSVVGAQEQGVLGNVTAGDTGRPLEGAMVLLLNEAGTRINGVLSATNGWFRVAAPAPGRYKLRVERIGYASTDTPPFDVAAGQTVDRKIVTSVKPVELASIEVSGGRRCELRPAEGVATATVWEEARKALAAATWTSEREMYQFSWMRFARSLDPTGHRVLSEQRSFARHFAAEPFAALPPDQLAANGFVQTTEGGGWHYYAPDAKVMLSDDFLDTHCFRLEREEREGVRMIGLAFEPIAERRLPDVAGTLWLEQSNARLRSLEFRYVNLMQNLPAHESGGELNFSELPNGTWIVKDWRIRMPRIAEERDGQGRSRRFVITAYQDEGAVVQQAQTASGTKILDELMGGIHGTVSDSVGRPAAGLRVWLEGTQFETVSDLQGGFSFSGVGRGLYRVAAISDVLAEAGTRGAYADVEIEQKGITEVRLELPSLARSILDRCLAAPPRAGQAVVTGRVLDRSGTPVSGAEVTVGWDQATGSSTGVRISHEGLSGQSGDDGVFTFCGVPTDRTVELRAKLGERESSVVSLPLALKAETAVARIVLP